MNNLLIYLTHPYVKAWNFKERQVEQFCRQYPEAEVMLCHRSRDFLEKLPQAEGVIVWYFKSEWLGRAPNLRWIATPAAGREWIDLPQDSSITVHHGGFHGMMMAESVLGAVLYFAKAFELSRSMQEKKKWAPIKISDRIGSLYQSQVTILGFGRIGTAIGRVIKPFGCRLAGVKRTPIAPPDYFDEGDRIVTVEDLDSVLPDTDHLIVVLPGGEETDGLLSKDRLAMLPKHACLYNVGRGNAVREVDLVNALQGKQIAGAYLDVFETEPLPESSPLWELPNVLLQPHISAASPQYLDLFVEELLTKLKMQG